MLNKPKQFVYSGKIFLCLNAAVKNQAKITLIITDEPE